MQHESELLSLVRRTDWFMRALCAVRDLNLTSWCIGAGAVRNMVWDSLHGYAPLTNESDIDVAFFDSTRLDGAWDQELQARLELVYPSPWEVTNQAAVHTWFERYFGHPVTPLASLTEAVSTWPEYATSVGITLNSSGDFEIIAPYGLDDLFEMRIRRNPARVSLETFRQRIVSKRYIDRWPLVKVVND